MAIRDDASNARTPRRRRADHDVRTERKRVRVLAVDDDPAYLKYLKLILTRAGFDVQVTLDATGAFEKLQSEPNIDLLVVDLSMPIMDGIELVRQLRGKNVTRGVYAILLTAHDGRDIKLTALEAGLDDFLTKTSSNEEIIAKLRSAARRVEMERRLHIENEELQALALTDELTGIANRRALFREGEQLVASGRKLSVVLFDLDRFKQINDTCGHHVGDRILADVAATFRASTRYGDIIARYGGDEFVLLLPESDAAAARVIAERLGDQIAALRWETGERTLRVSASFGLAEAAGGMTFEELLIKCDRELYRRKARSAAGATKASKTTGLRA